MSTHAGPRQNPDAWLPAGVGCIIIQVSQQGDQVLPKDVPHQRPDASQGIPNKGQVVPNKSQMLHGPRMARWITLVPNKGQMVPNTG